MISEHASPLGVLGGVDSGGQNVYVGQLARHLAELGYEVDVFTRRDSDRLPEVAEWVSGIRIVHVPAGPPVYVRKEDMLPYMGEFADYLLRFCRCQRGTYDLAHANFWMSGLVACELKRGLDLPFVITFHALGRVRRLHQRTADQFPDQRFDVEDRIVAEADHILAECPQDEEDLIRLYNADPAKITIIPCGFDPTELAPISKPLARFALGLPADERVILQLGRMVPRKGVDTAIRGLARLIHQHGIRARLVIVGGDSDAPDPRVTPELGRLQEIARAENVADGVTIVGRRGRETLKYYYSAADVFVTVPWYEPFGITPVEAMACGTPVIGSNVGGIKFSVRDGETGYLIPPNDPDALAERLAYLYQHPKLMGVLSRQAVGRANDLFTWQKITDHVVATYERVLAASRTERRDDGRQLAAIDRRFGALGDVLQESRRRLQPSILQAAEELGACFARNGKVLLCGIGGGSAVMQDFAAELVGRFDAPERAGLPAQVLNNDPVFITGWSNRRGFDGILARQVEAFGRPGDVLLGVGVQGRSHSLVQAFHAARERGLRRVAILGGNGGEVRQLADTCIIIPSADARILHEVQIVLVHLLGELLEERLSSTGSAKPAGANGVTLLPAARNGIRRARRASPEQARDG
jgi:glycosyltransferase involved in cell wall biosynthesis/phosphoheptose isomerase